MRLRQYIVETKLPDIPEEEHTFDNLPRYADGKPRVPFTQWLGIKSAGDKGYDGKHYGWSHRAIHGFTVGEVVKPGTIGNKYQYSDEVEKKYIEMYKKEGFDVADKWLDDIKFEPYAIKTEKEAKDHAIRFARSVS